MGLWIFIAAILTVVMIHEGGHFLMAKAFGFKATQYFLGFGPTVFSFKKGETEYGVKALPLGGFVKIVGMNPYEEVPPEDEHRAYGNKPKWQRALVIVAGSGTHFIVAFLLLFGTFLTIGIPEAVPTVSAVERQFDGEGTAAAVAGIEVGDKIIGYDGKRTDSWDEIREYLADNPGTKISLTIDRDGQILELTPTLGAAIFSAQGELLAYAPAGEQLRALEDGEELVGFLGVSPTMADGKEGFVGALGKSGSKTWEAARLSVNGIGQTATMVFGGGLWEALTGEGARQPDEGPMSIVGLSRVANDSVQTGASNLILIIVFFTVFVGLMNLLPLPPLDGGHLAVIAYEGITGKSVDLRKLIPVAATVIAFFVVLFIAALYLDIVRPIEGF
jgi:membrane-associated protease RseP (regulator of RpoE activity)